MGSFRLTFIHGSNKFPTFHRFQECFCLSFNKTTHETSPILECFHGLLVHLGPSIVDLFFRADKGGVHWIEFLRGYIRCCGRMSASMSLNNLYRLYAATRAKAGNPLKLEFESDDADSKISGSFVSTDVLMLLWMCWIMSQSYQTLKFSDGKTKVDLPDIKHLILSAVVSCTEVGNDLNIWDCNILNLEYQLPAGKIHTWALTTVPGLVQYFTQYLHGRLQRFATSEVPYFFLLS